MVKSVWANKLGSRTKVDLRLDARGADLQMELERDLHYLQVVKLLSGTTFLQDRSSLTENEEVSVVVVKSPAKAIQQIKANLIAVEGFLRKPETEDEVVLGTYHGPINEAIAVIQEYQEMLEPHDIDDLHTKVFDSLRYGEVWTAIGFSEDFDDCMWRLASLYGSVCVDPTCPCAADLRKLHFDSWLRCATVLLHQRQLNESARFNLN